MKMLILCLFLVCLPSAFGCFAGPIAYSFHQREDNCVSKSGISYAKLEDVRLNRKVPDDSQMNIFALCIMESYNVINSDGSVNPDILSYEIPVFDTNIYENTAKQCKILRGRDSGDTARKIMNCFMGNNHDIMGLERNPNA